MGWTLWVLNPDGSKRFIFSKISRWFLGATQSPIQWVTVFDPRVKVAGA
jgi:hypothetical protein